jgi:hypothetical protein
MGVCVVCEQSLGAWIHRVTKEFVLLDETNMEPWVTEIKDRLHMASEPVLGTLCAERERNEQCDRRLERPADSPKKW